MSSIKELTLQFNSLRESYSQYPVTDCPKSIKKFSTKAIGRKRLDMLQVSINRYNEKPVVIFKGRKGQVYSLLSSIPISVPDISITLGISNRNVSSLLTYLRRDGIVLESTRIKKVHFISKK